MQLTPNDIGKTLRIDCPSMPILEAVLVRFIPAEEQGIDDNRDIEVHWIKENVTIINAYYSDRVVEVIEKEGKFRITKEDMGKNVKVSFGPYRSCLGLLKERLGRKYKVYMYFDRTEYLLDRCDIKEIVRPQTDQERI